MPVYHITVGEKIKEYRRANHLSQSAFGEMLGVSPQAVCKWEQNLCYPDIFILPHLARILGCQTDDFFRLPSRCEPPVDENFISPIDNC